jgi:hypothetical protein
VPGIDPVTKEETVTVKLKPRTQPGQPLSPLQRGIVVIVASTRPKVKGDWHPEATEFLTILPRRAPVAIAFTASVTSGRQNAVFVAGANLRNARIAMAPRAGVQFEPQFSGDDNLVGALVSVDAAAGKENLKIKLVDDSAPDVSLPEMEVEIKAPADSIQPRLVTDPDDRPEVDTSGFAP